MGVIWIIWMIQLQSDTLFFIGNFTIFVEIETQLEKVINTIQKWQFPHAHFACFSLFLQITLVQLVDPSW